MQVRIEIRKRRFKSWDYDELRWRTEIFTVHEVDGELDYQLAEYWDKTWHESISKAFARLAKAEWHWHNDRLSELILRGRNDG